MEKPDFTRSFLIIIGWAIIIIAPLELLVSAMTRLTNELRLGTYNFNGSFYGLIRAFLSLFKSLAISAVLLFLAKHGWKDSK